MFGRHMIDIVIQSSQAVFEAALVVGPLDFDSTVRLRPDNLSAVLLP